LENALKTITQTRQQKSVPVPVHMGSAMHEWTHEISGLGCEI